MGTTRPTHPPSELRRCVGDGHDLGLPGGDYARTFVNHGVLGIEDLPRLLADPEAWSRVDRALSRIPGEGQHGTRRSHFWTLCGVDDRNRIARS